MARFAKIGIVPGQPFDAAKVDPALLSAIDEGVKDARKSLEETGKATLTSNGLFGTREFLKNDYMKRSIGAALGLFGNSEEEAWYGGYIISDGKAGTVHFTKDKLPPARFFWSITLYTLPDRFLYDNVLNRYSIGDRTKGLKYGEDGSLTLYVSHESPGKDKESNWLPSPTTPFNLVARIYGPSEAAMKGDWTLPPLVPAQSGEPAAK
jgi:hypothetical protein